MTCRRSKLESSVDVHLSHGVDVSGEAASVDLDLKRSTPHAAREWAEIRPRFEYLYIALDMTLRDCMAKLEHESSFYARAFIISNHVSESMYKKRIKAWKISKSVKSKHKDEVIAEMARVVAAGKHTTITCRRSIRHDKLIRHAQARVKAGLLEPELLQRLQDCTEVVSIPVSDQSSSQNSPDSTFSLPYHASPSLSATSTSASPPPTLPSPLAKFDSFLRALHTVIDREHQEWTSPATAHLNPNSIVISLTQGIHHWSRADYTTARSLFSTAAQSFVADLQSPNGPVVTRMTYFVGGLVWAQISNPAVLQFRHFMVQAAREILGKGNPLEALFEGLNIEQCFEMQETVWLVAMAQYRMAGKPERLFGMARQRWLYCLEHGMTEWAWTYREHACASFAELGLLSEEMVRLADGDFGVLPRRIESVEVSLDEEERVELL